MNVCLFRQERDSTMKTRFLNVSIASIRFDKVPVGVTSGTKVGGK